MSVADWSQMSKSWRMCDGGVLAQSSHDAVHPGRRCRQSATTPMNATPQPLPPPPPSKDFRLMLPLLMFFFGDFPYFFFFFMCVNVCLQACLCTMSVQYPWKPKVGARFPGTGTIDRCKLPCGCWESNLRPLETPSHLSSPGPVL